jgi:uncharacterized protein
MNTLTLAVPARDLLGARVWATARRTLAAAATIALMALLSFSSAAWAAEGDPRPVPKLEKRVTDTTATLSSGDEARIEQQLKAFESRKGAQIAVLIVDSTIPETAFDYATRVFTEWKLGRKGIDDGVLLVVAKGDRKMQILTGPGISGSLTDAASKRIISEIISPKFRAGDFVGGIESGVSRMIAVIDGEALPPPPKKRVQSAQGGGVGHFIFLAIFAALFVGPLLRSVLGRFLGASATGGVTGFAAWVIAGGLALPIVAGVLVFFVVLFMGAFRGWGGGGGWTSGGGWSSGGGGFSGGDSGGFSGGGGSFDGGGASGDW